MPSLWNRILSHLPLPLSRPRPPPTRADTAEEPERNRLPPTPNWPGRSYSCTISGPGKRVRRKLQKRSLGPSCSDKARGLEAHVPTSPPAAAPSPGEIRRTTVISTHSSPAPSISEVVPAPATAFSEPASRSATSLESKAPRWTNCLPLPLPRLRLRGGYGGASEKQWREEERKKLEDGVGAWLSRGSEGSESWYETPESYLGDGRDGDGRWSERSGSGIESELSRWCASDDLRNRRTGDDEWSARWAAYWSAREAEFWRAQGEWVDEMVEMTRSLADVERGEDEREGMTVEEGVGMMGEEEKVPGGGL